MKFSTSAPIRTYIPQGTWKVEGDRITGTYDNADIAMQMAAKLAKKGFLDTRRGASDRLPQMDRGSLEFSEGRLDQAYLPIKPELCPSFLRVTGLGQNSVTLPKASTLQR